jgi:hypothetical protein
MTHANSKLNNGLMTRLGRPRFRPEIRETTADRMAPLHSESIELPKNECSLSESFGGPQFPLPYLPVPGRAIAVRETADSIGSSHRPTPLTHTGDAQDEFPEGGYG